MSAWTIRAIAHEETHVLRQAVLRPHQRAEDLVYPGDDATDAGHFGAFVDGAMVGIASICRQSMDGGEDNPGAWRVRGMAVAPSLQGKGAGRALLEACIEHARSHGGGMVWCNARTPACGFYRAMGFTTQGDEFEIEGIGPHYVMVLGS